MPNPFTLSSMTALALAGTGLGLYLGKSAVAEINPAYFGSAASETRFHSDLVAKRPTWDNPPAVLQNAALTTGYGTGCVGCRAYPEEYFPVHDPAVDENFDQATSNTDRIIEEAELEIAEMARRAQLASVERYAHYPVSDEEKPALLAQAQGPASGPADQSQDGCAAEGQCDGEPAPGI